MLVDCLLGKNTSIKFRGHSVSLSLNIIRILGTRGILQFFNHNLRDEHMSKSTERTSSTSNLHVLRKTSVALLSGFIMVLALATSNSVKAEPLTTIAAATATVVLIDKSGDAVDQLKRARKEVKRSATKTRKEVKRFFRKVF